MRVVALILIFITSLPIASQTGGSYDLSHNVIASGGGSNSTGGTYTVDGTAGQGIAGVQSSNPSLSVRGGFWVFQPLAPTAAGTTISGRVVTTDEYGITNARLTLTNAATGEVRTILTSSFGYYRFDDVPVGAFYQLQVSTKRYVFKEDTRFFNLVDEVTDVNFVGVPAR